MVKVRCYQCGRETNFDLLKQSDSGIIRLCQHCQSIMDDKPAPKSKHEIKTEGEENEIYNNYDYLVHIIEDGYAI